MRFYRMKMTDCSFIAAVALAGCAAPQPQPEPPVLADNQETVAAAQSYRACLRDAAHYADANYANNGQLPVSQVATVIAPMCYAQFSRWEKAQAAGLRGQGLAGFQKGADQRQLDYADRAVRQERGLASLVPNGTQGQP
jgi:hypothetical protein